jgi:RimJ/RimL family protein N-acetyltransferase
MEPVTLTDGDLLMRAPTANDVDVITAAIQGDPEIGRWTTVPWPYSRADAETFVDDIAGTGWDSGREPTWLVTAADGGALLGALGFHNVANGMAEVGYWAAAHARGRGFTSRALWLACEWGFTELGLGRIEWQAYVENAASRRVAEKVGFHIEGLVRQRLVQRGVRRDAYIGSLLPGELVPYADLTGRREA